MCSFEQRHILLYSKPVDMPDTSDYVLSIPLIFPRLPILFSFFTLILMNMQMRQFSCRPKISVKLSNGITGVNAMCNDASLARK